MGNEIKIKLFDERGARYVLGHFAKGTPFLAEIDDDPDATSLSTVYTLLDSIDEVWFASANVRSKDVGAVTCKCK